MASLPSASEVTSLVAVLAPGLVILGIRTRFREGPPVDLKDRLIAYAVASSAYYALAHPLFHAENGIQLPLWLWQLLLYFIVPAVVGLAVVAIDRSEYFYWAARKLKLRTTHHIPAAWDYAFSKIVKGTFVLVRLNDGTRYAGVMGKESFASSATAERDLYIEEVWSVPKQGNWERIEPVRAVLLCGKDIKWVEIFRRS